MCIFVYLYENRVFIFALSPRVAGANKADMFLTWCLYISSLIHSFIHSFVHFEQGAPGPVGPLGPSGPSGEKVNLIFLSFSLSGVILHLILTSLSYLTRLTTSYALSISQILLVFFNSPRCPQHCLTTALNTPCSYSPASLI